MFGYVVINKPELKIKDFDLYQSFYCGLCSSLHTEFGRIGQVALNFDMTFLHIVLSGLYEPEEDIQQERCIMHPLHKHTRRCNKTSSYAADMTILLTYLKCEDDLVDDHKKQAYVMKQLLQRKFQTVKKKYPEKVAKIQAILASNEQLEKQSSTDLDSLASLTGHMMGEIFAYQQDEWRNTLYQMGDYLGRFIYLMDAYDDLEEDKEKGEFNPFLTYEQKADFDDWVKEILELMMAQCCDAFERLPILIYTDIIRNILYSGVWAKYEAVRKKRLGEQDE